MSEDDQGRLEFFRVRFDGELSETSVVKLSGATIARGVLFIVGRYRGEEDE